MEQTRIIWEYRPSQGANLGVFLSCFLIVTWPWAVWRYYRTGNTHYILKEEKLIIRQGVRQVRQEDIFLDKVEDVQLSSSFWMMLTGLGGIALQVQDRTRRIKLSGLEDAVAIKNSILQQVAEARKVTAALQRGH